MKAQRKMISSDWKSEMKKSEDCVEIEVDVREAGRGLVPPTIESMREPRTSRVEAPEMGGIGDIMPWNQGNPH